MGEAESLETIREQYQHTKHRESEIHFYKVETKEHLRSLLSFYLQLCDISSTCYRGMDNHGRDMVSAVRS